MRDIEKEFKQACDCLNKNFRTRIVSDLSGNKRYYPEVRITSGWFEEWKSVNYHYHYLHIGTKFDTYSYDNIEDANSIITEAIKKLVAYDFDFTVGVMEYKGLTNEEIKNEIREQKLKKVLKGLDSN